jgi:hypothetical protein
MSCSQHPVGSAPTNRRGSPPSDTTKPLQMQGFRRVQVSVAHRLRPGQSARSVRQAGDQLRSGRMHRRRDMGASAQPTGWRRRECATAQRTTSQPLRRCIITTNPSTVSAAVSAARRSIRRMFRTYPLATDRVCVPLVATTGRSASNGPDFCPHHRSQLDRVSRPCRASD